MATRIINLLILACGLAAVAETAAFAEETTGALPWQGGAARALEAAQSVENDKAVAARKAADEAKAAAEAAKAAASAAKSAAAASVAGGDDPVEIDISGKPLPKETAAAEPAPEPGPDGKPTVPAKKLFGAVKAPADLKARAIGSYSKGCLAGGKALPVDGPAWQAMRLSRNRNWGHPELVALVERFAGDAKAKDGWPGLLVGDLAQPRGGPMLTGHASHQIGLDADIWFTPMPDRKLTYKERETISATSMLASDSLSVNPKAWGEGQAKIVKRVASYPAVERVLVHPAIKKALCETAGTDRTWLNKVRPFWGHYYHFHVRIGCPTGSAGCAAQAPIPGNDGCGKELEDWYKLLNPPPPPKDRPKVVKPATPPKPKPEITLADLPAECRVVLDDGKPKSAVSTGVAAAKPAVKSDPKAAASAAPAKLPGPKLKEAAAKK